MEISDTRLSLSFLLSLFMLTDLMATDALFSCLDSTSAVVHSILDDDEAPESRDGVVTYNMYPSIDLSEAALANVLQALESSDDLVCRARRRGRRCRPARGVGIRCWCGHDGGGGRPAKAQLPLEYCSTAQLPAQMWVQRSCQGVAHGLVTTGLRCDRDRRGSL